MSRAAILITAADLAPQALALLTDYDIVYAGKTPTEDDIVANPKNLELVRLAHESTQTAYDDPQIDGVILGADDLDPALGVTSEDAVLLEDSSAESSAPYIIVVATTAPLPCRSPSARRRACAASRRERTSASI